MPLEYCLPLLAEIKIKVTDFENCTSLWNFIFKFQSEVNRAIAVYLQTLEGKKTYETHHALLDLAYTIDGVCNTLCLRDIREQIASVWMAMDFEGINNSFNSYIQQAKMHEKDEHLSKLMNVVQEAKRAGISLEEIENHIHKMFGVEEHAHLRQTKEHVIRTSPPIESSVVEAAKLDDYVVAWNTNGLTMETFKHGIECLAKRDGWTAYCFDHQPGASFIVIGYIKLTPETTIAHVVWKMSEILPKSKKEEIQYWCWNYGDTAEKIPNGIKLLFSRDGSM